MSQMRAWLNKLCSGLYPHYALTSLQSPRFVTVPLHDSYNVSSFVRFWDDIIVSEVESNPGEFQAWAAELFGKVVPWYLPVGKATWEVDFSMWWDYLEATKSRNELYFPLKTVRCDG
jgi:hypothetical protein